MKLVLKLKPETTLIQADKLSRAIMLNQIVREINLVQEDKS